MQLQRRRFLQLAGATAAVMSPFTAWAQAEAPLKMRVGSGVGLAAVQSLYAQEIGMYKKHGLDVALEFPLSGKMVLERFEADKIDIGDMNNLSIALAIEAGHDYVIIAPGANYDSSVPTTMLVQAPTSDFKTGKDLEGKTVATLETNDIALVSVKKWIEATGGDLSKVSFVHGIPMIEVDKPLAEGRIHAALIANPNLTILLSKGTVKVLAKPFDAIGPVFTPASFFAKRSWVNANREAVRRFAAAIDETAKWATANHGETVKILAKAMKVPEDHVANMPHARYPGRLNLESIRLPLEAAMKYGALKPMRVEDIVIDTLKD